MTVWDDQHPKPAGGDDYERSLVRWMTEDSDKQIAALRPTNAESLAKYREVVGGAVDVLVGCGLPPADAISLLRARRDDRGSFVEIAGLVRNSPQGEEVPVVLLRPKKWNRQVVIWAHERGKQGLYDTDGSPAPQVRRLLDSGAAVACPDLLDQGELLADGQPLAAAPPHARDFAGFTYGYNSPLLAERAHDILSVIAYCRHHERPRPQKLCVVALGGAGPWAAAALAQAPGEVDRAAIDTAGFRFRNLKSITDINLLPGAVKYGDLPGILALCAPAELWLAGEGGQAPDVVAAAYKAAGLPARLHAIDVPDDKKAASAVDWLLR
jgi:hypothetical protein